MTIADKTWVRNRTGISVCCVVLLLVSFAAAQLVPGSMEVHWDQGAADCAKVSLPPLQVHAYNPQTYILRQNLCSTFEAPFLYLLIGSNKALLIDTGDIADPQKMPLAKTVLDLLPSTGSGKLPLLVVHTHRHLDHRAGDGQFQNLPNVQVVGYEVEKVKEFYKFTQWPNGLAQIDLGDRIVDVIPSPGHNETEVSFYDRQTGLFFSGDFLIPGRLLIDDTPAELATAQRVADFVRDRPVSFVLGGHIEKNAAGELLPWESQYHPNEHVLQLTKADLLALPAAVHRFNGFYTTSGQFVMMNSMRMLYLYAGVLVIVLAVFVWLLVRFVRRRRARRTQSTFAKQLS
jgi:glyoxylase-like metal-dependent hydrolase (beta-lactamase superfamily II)